MAIKKPQQTILLGFALSLVAITVLLLIIHHNITATENQMNTIIHQHSTKLDHVYEMRHAMMTRHGILMNSAAMPEQHEPDEARLRFHASANLFASPYRALREMGMDQEETDILDQLDTALEKTRSLQNTYLEKRIDTGNRPSENHHLFQASNAYREAVDILDALIAHIRNKSGQDEREAHQSYTDTRFYLFTMGGLTLMVITAIAFFVLRKNQLQTRKIQELASLPADNPSPVFRITTSGRIIFANDPGKRILNELQLKTGDYAPDFWRDSVRHLVTADTVSETHLDIEALGRHFSFIATNISENGYVNLYGYDVTSLEQTKRKLQDEASNMEHLARLPQENPFPVLRLGTDGRILFSNKAGEAVLDDWACKTGDFAPVYWHHTLCQLVEENTTKFVYEATNGKVLSFQIVAVFDQDYIDLFGHDVTNLEQNIKLEQDAGIRRAKA